MKTLIIIIAALLIGFGAGYIIIGQSEDQATTIESSSTQQYTCGMHPEIVTNEPGYCPICGMKLTLKKDGGQAAEGSIVIDPTTIQNMGLTTMKAAKMKLTKPVRAFGKVEYSEPMIRTINVKIPGWVEKLYVNYEGAAVKTGEPLFEIYSPELVAAQREYLVAYKNSNNLQASALSMAAGGSKLLDAASMRLKNWDISSDQIQNLAASGELTKSMLIRSPYNGIVVAKHIDLGDRLNPGMTVYKIADISNVWVSAFVYEQDLPFLKHGQNAIVNVSSLPDKRFQAGISYISPDLDKNQQVEIRLDVDNYDFMLKPGMYAEVFIQSSLPDERLVVPSKAVINSGVKEVVYLANEDGSFEPKIIQTGAAGDNDYVEVLSGLNPGDNVVISGQFLLDSESRLNESLAFTHNHGSQLHGGSQSVDKMEESLHEKHEMEEGEDHSEHRVPELSGIYTCPMPEHYHVLQYGEGKCIECGMDLVPVEKTDNSDVYFCPMTEDWVVSNKPGDCPICGMKLKKLN